MSGCVNNSVSQRVSPQGGCRGCWLVVLRKSLEWDQLWDTLSRSFSASVTMHTGMCQFMRQALIYQVEFQLCNPPSAPSPQPHFGKGQWPAAAPPPPAALPRPSSGASGERAEKLCFLYVCAGLAWLGAQGFASPLQQGYLLEGVFLTDGTLFLSRWCLSSALFSTLYYCTVLWLLVASSLSSWILGCCYDFAWHLLLAAWKPETGWLKLMRHLLCLATAADLACRRIIPEWWQSPLTLPQPTWSRLACFDPILEMVHLKHDSAQLGVFKLVMEMQINVPRFDSAWPKMPMEKLYDAWTRNH